MRQGWEPAEYVENKTGRHGLKRPVLRKLLTDARRKRFTIMAVWDLDRFSSSLRLLISGLATLDAWEYDL